MEYLPNLLEHKDLLVCFAVLLVLIFVTLFATSHLLIATNERQTKEQQIVTMTNYLNQWKEKSARINSATMRPVDASQLDSVQTAVLFNIQSNQLSLSTLREETGKNTQNGKSYEMEFEGAYPQVIQCLEHFQAKDALISIESLSMSQRQGKIQTKMTYKVYTK